MPFDAYVFDLYGTLVDYGALGTRYGPDGDAFVLAWRQKQLQYTFAATIMRRYVDFDTLTGLAYAYVAKVAGKPYDAAASSAAVRAWSELPAFGEAAATLRALRAGGYRTAVLSNGTPAGIAAALASCGLRDVVDAALSVDTVGAFKPHPDVYRLAVTHFDSRPERIAFVSSNGWDASGAAEFGLSVTWCNRANLPGETFGAAPVRTIARLAELLA
jgi:2-haloacid dehalogenase